MDNINIQEMSDNLWKRLIKLWNDGEDKSQYVKEMVGYLNGRMKSSGFDDWNITPANICRKIAETKKTNMLDAQFSLSVAPVYNAFSDPKQMRDISAIADVLDEEVKNICKNNDIETVYAILANDGIAGGYGAIQTYMDFEERAEGEIKVKNIDSLNVRWNKGAKTVDELTFIAYQIEMNPWTAKKRYGTDAEGNWIEDICKRIDTVTESSGEHKRGSEKGIVNIQSSETSQRAYVYDSNGIVSGQTVKLMVMFLLDDSMYAPEKSDSLEEAQEKLTLKSKYPNGRMIVFSPKDNKKLILEDKPAPESFKGLGNIDIFNPAPTGDLTGRSEIEDLKPIQDRINGCYIKLRYIVQNHIRTLGADDQFENSTQESDFVNHAITYIEGAGNDPAKALPVVSNELLSDIEPIMMMIRQYKDEANEVSRINDTMATGERQTGTTSAEQVEVLQESPMASIRSLQRSFKSTVVRVAEKIIKLIQAHYTVQRIVRMSTGITIDGQTYKSARFNKANAGTDNESNVVEFLDEAGNAAKTIKLDPDWQFRVECVAGTEIPRSRRETANLMNMLFNQGVFTNPQLDIDILETYLRAIDLPNYRALIRISRMKREEAAKQPPRMPKIEEVLSNKDFAVAFADVLRGLEGFSQAKAGVLEKFGLKPVTDTLESAPIQSVTAKSDVGKIAAISPARISADPQKSSEATSVAQLMELIQHLSPDHVAETMRFMQGLEGGGNNAI